MGSKSKTKTAQLCLQKCKTTSGCVATNWHKKKGCFLLSAYNKLQSKKGWTAGQCAASPSPTPPSPSPNPPSPSPTPPSPSPTVSCSAEIFKNKQYKYKKSDLIAKSKSKNVNACLKTAMRQTTGVLVSTGVGRS